ncbi:Ubiquitin carboxyl-terminal hydrolase MINDY-2 [Boothiomyces macroporosus]|uniref:Ubiquitin carboxyl-terminal hydrolase MINDY-2 n=1 Tax=Boothiomyces macroporosus TaxID=261099 RepID=A0AAD5U9X6_9FUNG|nr:Ubiquitin carboxyl-terminal hydrolase MINDY-2 [Boothiomyces macroporosus]
MQSENQSVQRAEEQVQDNEIPTDNNQRVEEQAKANTESKEAQGESNAEPPVLSEPNKPTEEKFKCKQIAPDKCILLQNENGPCPLLALANLLSITNRIEINRDLSLEELLNLLCQYILSIQITNANDEKILDDTLKVLPRLNYGLDVNIYFDSIHVEYTDLLSPFELLRIQIYHGWVIDPQDQYYKVINNLKCYNKVVEEGIKDTVEGLVCREFLQQGQLTLAGIEALLVTVNEPCVFFYNNHFSVLTRNENKLYCLVTDEGYFDEDVVWQDLVLDGDCKFYNYNFQEFGTGNDDELARQLQQQYDYEEQQRQQTERAIEQREREQRHERVGTESTSSSKEKKKDCIIQ